MSVKRKYRGLDQKRLLVLHLQVRLLELEDLAANEFHFLDLRCDCNVELAIVHIGLRASLIVKIEDDGTCGAMHQS